MPHENEAFFIVMYYFLKNCAAEKTKTIRLIPHQS